MADLQFTAGANLDDIRRELATLRADIERTAELINRAGSGKPAFEAARDGAAQAARAVDELARKTERAQQAGAQPRQAPRPPAPGTTPPVPLTPTAQAARQATRPPAPPPPPGPVPSQLPGAPRGTKDFNDALTGAIGLVQKLAAGLAALAAVNVFADAASAGVAFNSAIEDANLGIASLISAQAKLRDEAGRPVEGADALTVALSLAEDQMFKLRVAGLETAATTTQLAAAFQAAVGAGIGAGLSLDQIRQITIQTTQAASALGVPMDQISQEVRSILDGTIDTNSRVATTLGITNEQVKTWKASGKLVDELNKRMEAFGEAGKAAANNFSVIKSNASEALESLSGDVFRGFFEQLKGGMKDATSGLFDTKRLAIADNLSDAADLARQLAAEIGEGLADGMRLVVELVRDFSAYVGDNNEEFQVIVGSAQQLAGQIGAMLRLVLQVAAGIGDAAIKTGVLSKAVQTVSLILAGIRDGFRVMGALVVGIGAMIIKAVLTPFREMVSLSATVARALGFADAAGTLDGVAAAMERVSERGAQAARDLIQPVLEGKGAVAEVIAGFDDIADAAAEADAKRRKAAESPKPTTTPAPKGSIAGKKFETPAEPAKADSNQVDKDRLDQELKALERRYADGLISIADYFRERSRLQKAAVDEEIATEREKLAKLAATDAAGRRDAATKLALLGEKKKAIQADNDRAQLEAERELAGQILDIRAQELEAEGKLEDAAAIRSAERFKALLQRLRTEGDTKNAGLVERLIDLDVARARFAELRAEFDRQIADMQRQQEGVRSGVAAGSIDPRQAQALAEQATQGAQPGLQATAQAMQDLAGRVKDPALLQAAQEVNDALRRIGEDGATGLDAAVRQLRTSLADMAATMEQAAVNAGVDALAGFFEDMASGSKSAGEALRDFVASFVRSMIRIAAQALATLAVLSTLDAIYPGLGQAAAAGLQVGGTAARVKHSGGDVGQGTLRQVSPLAFLGAPRFHGGSGVLGVRPGELPAILQDGERVQSRAEVAAAGRSGQGGNTRIINTIDPALAADWMQSPAGEKVVLNHITRNASTLGPLLRK